MVKYLNGLNGNMCGGLNFHPILPIIIGYQTSEDKSLNQVCIWSISSDNPIPYASVIPVDRSNKYYNTIGILKIHPSLPILAVIKERSNIVKIYKFSDNGSQVELIETLNNRFNLRERQQLLAEIQEVQAEYKAGQVQFGSVNYFLEELDN